jgi:hypothetical protein
VEFALKGNRLGDDILEGFHARGSLRPGRESSWVTVPVEH